MLAMVHDARRFVRLREKSSFLLILDKARPPEKAAREELKNFFNVHQAQIESIGVWIRVDGLFGATIRSAATGIFMLGVPNVHVQFFSASPEVAAWIGDCTGRGIRESERALQSMLGGSADGARAESA